jgi:hypothetical protein
MPELCELKKHLEALLLAKELPPHHTIVAWLHLLDAAMVKEVKCPR